MTDKNEINAAEIVSGAVEKTESKNRIWWHKKRYWFAAAVIVAGWITLVPSCYRPNDVAPPVKNLELVRNTAGEIQYFKTLDHALLPRLADPGQNGFRDVLAALGPNVLEQRALAIEFADDWGGIKSDEEWGARWWNTEWVPLCQTLGIDPEPEPPLFSYHVFDTIGGWLVRHGITGNEPVVKAADPKNGCMEERIEWEKAIELSKQIQERPWTTTEYPTLAAWLDQAKPYFDIYSEAVKKPNYTSMTNIRDCSLSESEREQYSMLHIILPDVQASRAFARNAATRVMNRIATGDLDGAADDILAMVRLGRHLQNGQGRFIVERLVGIAIEGIAVKSLCGWLQYGEPSKEQLVAMLDRLDAIPAPGPLEDNFDVGMLFAFDVVKCVARPTDTATELGFFKRYSVLATCIDMLNEVDGNILDLSVRSLDAPLLALPLDLNAAYDEARRWNERCYADTIGGTLHETIMKLNELEKQLDPNKGGKRPVAPSRWTANGRGRWLGQKAALAIALEGGIIMRPAVAASIRSASLWEMARLAISLEEFKRDQGDYPQKLDELVPDYLAQLPNDPATDQPNFVYHYLTGRLGSVWSDENGAAVSSQPNEKTSDATDAKISGRYQLYSVSLNGKDDRGDETFNESTGGTFDVVLPRWR